MSRRAWQIVMVVVAVVAIILVLAMLGGQAGEPQPGSGSDRPAVPVGRD
jgi:hypothetical protein